MNTLLIPPTAEPVTLADAKAWLSIDTDDAVIGALVTTARQAAEDYTGCAFVTQTWRLTVGCHRTRRLPDTLGAGTYQLPYNYFDSPLPQCFDLPRRPVQSVVSATSHLADGTAAPVTNFRLSGNRLILTGAWPNGLRAYDPLDITYVAGYGDPSQVPGPIKTAILLGVQALYSGRSAGSTCSTELGDMPAGVKTLKAGDSTITRFSPGEAGSGVLPSAALSLLAPYKTYRL